MVGFFVHPVGHIACSIHISFHNFHYKTFLALRGHINYLFATIFIFYFPQNVNGMINLAPCQYMNTTDLETSLFYQRKAVIVISLLKEYCHFENIQS